MDPLGLNKTANTLTQAVPEVTGAVNRLGDKAEHLAEGLEETVTQVTDKGLSALADAVAQIVGAAYRLDGSTIEIEGLSISITNPKITFRLGQFKPE